MKKFLLVATAAATLLSACGGKTEQPAAEPVVAGPSAEDTAAAEAARLKELTEQFSSATTVAELGPLSIATSSFPELNKKVDEKLELIVRQKIDDASSPRDQFELKQMLGQLDSGSQLWRDVQAKVTELSKK